MCPRQLFRSKPSDEPPYNSSAFSRERVNRASKPRLSRKLTTFVLSFSISTLRDCCKVPFTYQYRACWHCCSNASTTATTCSPRFENPYFQYGLSIVSPPSRLTFVTHVCRSPIARRFTRPGSI